MTETLDVIARRYACRKYTGEPVPHDTLQTIALAGLHAPSAVNRQPWRIVVIPTKDKVDQISATGLERLKAVDAAGYERVMGRGGKLLYNASALMLVCLTTEPAPYPVEFDAGIVASHLALAATSLGVNCCVATMPGAAFDDPALRAAFIPDGFRFAISVLLGYADGQPGTPHTIDEAKIIWA